MKKYILLFITVFCFPSLLFASDGWNNVVNSESYQEKPIVLAYMNPGLHGNYGEQSSGGGGVVDYTADANCMGAWFMNGGLSANGDDETDRSGEGGALTEHSGDIPNSATVPAGYSGNSRDWEFTNGERLTHIDGNSTDINGANQSMSVCLWFKFESDTSADNSFVCKYNTTGNNRQYLFKFDDADDCLEVQLSSDGTVIIKAQGATGRAGIGTNWCHTCFVYNDTDIRIYLDGSLDSNGADNPKAYVNGIANTTAALRVGTSESENLNKLDGLMDELIFFDRELSTAEISDIKTNGIDGTKGGND